MLLPALVFARGYFAGSLYFIQQSQKMICHIGPTATRAFRAMLSRPVFVRSNEYPQLSSTERFVRRGRPRPIGFAPNANLNTCKTILDLS